MPSETVSPRRRWGCAIAASVAVGALLALLAAYKFIVAPMMIGKFLAAQQPPPVTISTALAEARAWQPSLHAVGSAVAVKGVDITTEAPGIIAEILFQSGEEVMQGAPLVRLNDAVEQADLQQNLALLKDATLQLERTRSLASRGNISQSALDSAQAQRDQAIAAVERTRALIAQKNIKAPFAGRLGVRLVSLGQYVSSGTAVVTLQALDPLFVNFTLPEQAIAQVAEGQAVEARVDAYPDRLFSGTITAIDAKVEATTRNLLIQATLANPDKRLVPGMFAAVRVLAGAPRQAITIPETAVSFSLYGDSVYVVKPAASDGTRAVERRNVRVGERQDGAIAILAGLAAGEEVVTVGQIKLRPGMAVAIDNTAPLVPPPQRPRL
ncbi:MAG: efflux RND transporter periplasmic adaptor subunit [Pseudomonadota bacterium]